MPTVRDFRIYSFLPSRVDRCGRHVGRNIYSKLYAIENTVRVAIHSVLTANIHANWWTVAVDKNVRRDAQRFRIRYLNHPQNANPGVHDIHLLYLKDLTEILRTNSHLFIAVVPDVDQWIARLEAIEIPRNLVGHMNFPNAHDRNAIDFAYSKLPSLLSNLTAGNIPIVIPK